MRRVLIFVHCTLKEKRAFGATNLNEIFTWVNASYAIHYDIRIHTGGAISMVLGVTHCRSSKQKLNKKISIEEELVGASDYVPQTYDFFQSKTDLFSARALI